MLFRLAAMFPSRHIPRGRFWGGEEGACIWGGLALEERTDRQTDGWMDGCQMGDGIKQKWLLDGVSCTRAVSLPRDSSPAP